MVNLKFKKVGDQFLDNLIYFVSIKVVIVIINVIINIIILLLLLLLLQLYTNTKDLPTYKCNSDKFKTFLKNIACSSYRN